MVLGMCATYPSGPGQELFRPCCQQGVVLWERIEEVSTAGRNAKMWLADCLVHTKLVFWCVRWCADAGGEWRNPTIDTLFSRDISQSLRRRGEYVMWWTRCWSRSGDWVGPRTLSPSCMKIGVMSCLTWEFLCVA